MLSPQRPMRRVLVLCALSCGAGFARAAAFPQDRLKSMPGYERHKEVAGKIPGSVQLGSIQGNWSEDGRTFGFRREGKHWQVELATGKISENPEKQATPPENGRGPQNPPRERGRQFERALSPDGKREAFCRDRNVWIQEQGGGTEVQVTREGDPKTRIKCGTASWVYGEELDQTTAMWWSPDGSMLAFYRFDESPVLDYYLQLDQTEIQSRMDVEAYPKAGTRNPIAEIRVYDLARKTTVAVDVRDQQPFTDDVVGHYAYGVQWSPEGKELLFHRTNRLQNVMEFCAADPGTGACRVIVREEWPASWTENTPDRKFLSDGRRFVWASERTGWKNFYLYDLSGRLLAPLTQHGFEVANIVEIDERAGRLWYTARSGENPMKLQLHRVGLDGTGDVRLTDPRLHHAVSVAPDGRHFTDTSQAHDVPPSTWLRDADGKQVAQLASSDLSKYDALGLKRVESFTFKAADGTTDLYGMLHFPSQFDPAKKYPLLVSVYAGPATNGARENFALPNPLTEYGFLVASLDSRSAAGRGKRFLDAIYRKLGTVEVDDQAAGVKELARRPYVNAERVGIFGTSYGGYVSAMAMVRHPETFHAACASSAVTDWLHYDTIYTERYMGTPQDNPEGYGDGSVMAGVERLAGRLMLFYGTADNNVHPNNTLQLVQALQRAGKSFELQVGPDQGHSALDGRRMMEFFIENLVLR